MMDNTDYLKIDGKIIQLSAKEKKSLEQVGKNIQVLISQNASAIANFQRVAQNAKNNLNKTKELQKGYFFNHGVLLPDKLIEFAGFVHEVVYPDENLLFALEQCSKDFNLFKRFHEYKQRCFENPNWNRRREIEYLNSEKIPELNNIEGAETVFNNVALKVIPELNQRLFDNGYINQRNKWQKDKKELAALIIALFNKKAFKSDYKKMFEEKGKVHTDIKSFFKTTYGDMGQYLEKAKRNKIKATDIDAFSVMYQGVLESKK